MRYILISILFLSLCGCVDAEMQSRMDATIELINQEVNLIQNLYKQHQAGTLTTAEVAAQVKLAEARMDALKEKYVSLKVEAEAKGYKWYEVLGSILGSVVAVAGGRAIGIPGLRSKAK